MIGFHHSGRGPSPLRKAKKKSKGKHIILLTSYKKEFMWNISNVCDLAEEILDSVGQLETKECLNTDFLCFWYYQKLYLNSGFQAI